MQFIVTEATIADDATLAAFSCWDGGDGAPWCEEAQNYVRGFALRKSKRVLMFSLEEDPATVVGVTAFTPSIIGLPFVEPVDHPTWHLDVLAVRLEDQDRGYAPEILELTFEHMRGLDASRHAVTAAVHRKNRHSLSACSTVGLEHLTAWSDQYVMLLKAL